MLTGTLNSIKEKRANFVREIAYLREMAEDDIIDRSMDSAESQYVKETSADYKEAADMIAEMANADFTAEDDAELTRIMEATQDMTFDQMIGIE